MPAGHKLKRLRDARNISVREVEQASRRIADLKSDRRFCVSNGWLAQLEAGASEPSMSKLFSLSVIYQVDLFDLFQLYGIDLNGNHNGLANAELASEPRGIVYAHLGASDLTMFPMIWPNAYLQIDTNQTDVAAIAWRDQYDRPIFFVELRGAYTCGWCELQGNQLLIVPHHSSPASVRSFDYPRAAEIVGRIISYTTTCVDLDCEQVQKTKAMAPGPAFPSST